MRRMVFLVILISMLSLLAVAWEGFRFLNFTSGEASETEVLDVPPGRNFVSVASELETKKYVSDGLYFKILARLTGADKALKVGEYELHRGMGPRQILQTISSGKSTPRSLTIPEGTNMYEIAGLLESKGLGESQVFLRLFKDKSFIKQLLGEEIYSLEGYLYPETYNFTKYTGNKRIVRMMVNNFLRVYESIEKPKDFNLKRHEVVTLASVIEKETGHEAERPMISSVFHNRLRRPMRLQSDPTILYGILDATGEMKANIRRSDILRFNRFNTYRVDRLPFGPIANPGEESLRAVFYPAQTKYLYFVSRNDGTHVFSETLKQHNSAVKKFQLDRRARKGKSWRDLEQSKSP